LNIVPSTIDPDASMAPAEEFRFALQGAAQLGVKLWLLHRRDHRTTQDT
jgi:hypothetical protein